MRRLLARLPVEHAVPILDCEDSAADVLDPSRSDQLKAAARANVLALFGDGWRPRCRTVGLRINGAGSDQHSADLEAATRLCRDGVGLLVLIPKVNAAEDIESVAAHFAAAGLEPPPLMPIFETGNGMRQIAAIVARTRPLLAGIVLGMIDYAFDRRWWPFPGPLSPHLWAVARTVADAAAAAGVTYVHTPCARLHDTALVLAIRHRLRAMCRGPFAMLTLSLDQTRAVMHDGGAAACCAAESDVPVDPVGAAREVVRRFRELADASRSFAVDAASDRFIPPQEYLAALRFLGDCGERP